jgi:hypothetical protein
MKRKINKIIIHCSDSPNGRPNTISDIDAWHKERGFKRSLWWRARFNAKVGHVGYHYVIGVGGTLWTGRHLDEIGAHAKGHNADSIGVCLIGRDKFTEAQWSTLWSLIYGKFADDYPKAEVIGHHQVQPQKTCPGFDVQAWFADGDDAPSGHVLTA